ncbi:MAG: hypothetical protein P4L35_19465 [Ignavibacteriaceae bacterium]|nr:hypothetical protein [Ignavibacteriaceae bacterium]
MYNTNRAIIAQNIPLRLTTEQIDSPIDVVADFFGAFDMEDSRVLLGFVISKVICLGDEDIEDFNRSEILTYYEYVELLIEAAFLICQKEGRISRLKKSADS